MPYTIPALKSLVVFYGVWMNVLHLCLRHAEIVFYGGSINIGTWLLTTVNNTP